MMKSEFENLAGRAVTNEQYRAIETLYMSSNLEKTEFVKSIRTMLKSIPQPERKKRHQTNGRKRQERLQKDTERMLLPHQIC